MLKRYQIATIAVLLASTASAQEFYVGGTVSAGQANFADNYSNEFEGNTQTLSLLGGVRFPIGGAAGSGMFVGGEVEVSFAQGYEGLTYADLSDTQKTIQAEIHVGYQMNTVAVYGFYGIGSNPMTRGYAI
ncbi:MAG: hypothetical protein JKY31_07270, partial [Rhodobacteraceae bacterium]|nr:hypothetical protein [Paracoccaceae bacterium]